MFRIIDFIKLIKWIAFLTTILSIMFYELLRMFWDENISLIKVISIAPWVSIVIILIITTSFTSRYLWKLVRIFNQSLYPDLNGIWHGEIIIEDGTEIKARIKIKQTLLLTQVELHTETSKSIPLEVTPTVECGQYKLYYVYRSIPKDPSRAPYTGSTIFDIRSKKQDSVSIIELSGSYFTNRKSIGRVRFEQINRNIHEDVSFY